jgi:hypothetical protein
VQIKLHCLRPYLESTRAYLSTNLALGGIAIAARFNVYLQAWPEYDKVLLTRIWIWNVPQKVLVIEDVPLVVLDRHILEWLYFSC